MRPIRYQFDHISKIVKGEVGVAQQSVQTAPNFADMWRRARRMHTDVLD